MANLILLILAVHAYEGAGLRQPPTFNSDVEYRDSRSLDANQEDYIKDLFFKHLQAYAGDVEDTGVTASYSEDIPRPGGFNLYREKSRARRNVDDSEEATVSDLTQTNPEEQIGKSSEPSDSGSEINFRGTVNTEFRKDEGLVGINDFIRFRRDALPDPKPLGNENTAKATEDQIEAVSISNGGRIGELSDLNQFRQSRTSNNGNQERTERMLMRDDNVVPDGSREPRGATKEQWVKQPYPVHSVNVDDNGYDDNVPSSSDVRAPRVHFVTQRRLESAPPEKNFENHNREGRTRNFVKDSAREPSTSSPRNMPPPRKPERGYYPDRHLKYYDPYLSRPFDPYYDDPYYRYEEVRYNPRYSSAERDRYRPEFSTRQRRIVYYATLPEVVRTPPNVNLRDRYNYQDRFDDRYVTSPSVSVAEGGYHFRKPYPFTKSRYEHEMERTKAPYPLKVSTDVNVRETKKNPERRIYSEPDRRYAYKAPSYRSEGSFERRT